MGQQMLICWSIGLRSVKVLCGTNCIHIALLSEEGNYQHNCMVRI